MKETRKISINNKVFQKRDLELINKIFIDEYNQSKDLGNNISFKFSCYFDDSTSLELSEPNMFKDNDFLDRRKSIKVSYSFYDFTDSKDISFVVKHGNSDLSEVEIIGEDCKWVGYMFDLFNEKLKLIQSQENFILKYKKIINIVLSIVLGFYLLKYIYNPILGIFIDNSTTPYWVIRVKELIKQNEILGYSVLYIIFITGCYIVGYPPQDSLMKWVLKLWPSIEFDFGPENKKIEKKRRTRVMAVISLVIIPALLDLILEYFKK